MVEGATGPSELSHHWPQELQQWEHSGDHGVQSSSQAQLGEGGLRVRGSLRRDRITRGGRVQEVPQEKSRARPQQGRRSRCEGLEVRPGTQRVGAGLHLRAQVPGKAVPAHTILLPPHPVPRTHLPGWGRTGSLPIRVEILVGVWGWAAGKGRGAGAGCVCSR